MSSLVLELRGVTRRFVSGHGTLEVLRGCDLQLHTGEMVALLGQSGSGKSTLLQIAGLLEPPTAGVVRIGDAEVATRQDRQRTKLRRQAIGFVYQYHHLLPEFSALENVVLPQLMAGQKLPAAEAYARGLLTSVGLAERLQHRPGQLSGGEQQRVAIARALANQPQVLIADEPTGNLDPDTAEQVFGVLQGLVRAHRLAVLLATHNHELARRAQRVVRLQNGLLTH